MGMTQNLKVFFGFSEDVEAESDNSAEVDSDVIPKSLSKGFKPSVISTAALPQPSKASSAVIIVEEPRIYEDSLNIAMSLRESKPVLVNLKYLDSDAGKRLIDFVCGTAYAINGHMLKVAENIFLFTPAPVRIENKSEKKAGGGNLKASTEAEESSSEITKQYMSRL